MFERWTDEARKALARAHLEATLLRHAYIGTEHLLLGLMADGDSVAARAIEGLGMDRSALREDVLQMVERGEHEPRGHVPFTPRSKKVLELSLREARRLGAASVGTQHLLLGLIREGEGTGAVVLAGRGATLGAVSRSVIDLAPSAPPAAPASNEVRFGGVLTDRGHRVMSLAGDVAARRGNGGIAPEDLLVALVLTEDLEVGRLLSRISDLEELRRSLRDRPEKQDQSASPEKPAEAERPAKQQKADRLARPAKPAKAVSRAKAPGQGGRTPKGEAGPKRPSRATKPPSGA